MIAGIQKHGGPAIVVDGRSYAPADIVKALEGPIDAADVTAAAAGAFHQAVTAEQSAIVKGEDVFRALKSILSIQYKSQSGTLADYGIVLPDKQAPDASKVATAVVKRAATRAARHTMGKRQKLAVTGTVQAIATGTVVTAAQTGVK
jgi:hypothetical protein